MTKQVETVQEGQSLSDIYKIMRNTGAHHVPVLSGNTLVGLVSFTDMMKLDLAIVGIDNTGISGIIDNQFTIEDVMSMDLVTMNDKQSVRDAVQLLGDGNFHSVPVVDETNALVGIVTSTDLIRYIGRQY